MLYLSTITTNMIERRELLPAAVTLCVDQVVIDHLHSPISDIVYQPYATASHHAAIQDTAAGRGRISSRSKEIIKPETRRRWFESKTFRLFSFGIDRFLDS